MMDKPRIYYLLERQLDGRISPEEQAELGAAAGDSGQVREVLQEMMEEQAADGALDVRRWDGQMAAVLGVDKGADEGGEEFGAVRGGRSIITRRRWWIAAAAAVIILVLAGYWQRGGHRGESSRMAVTRDVAPGGNKAILTLSNGQQIILDSAHNGMLADQGGMEVVKLGDGQVVYRGKGMATGAVLYNTMSTPRGGQYKLVLPDGTAVWLNAVSSITYPASFRGGSREVTMTGEAYFDVADDKARPFHVKVNEMDIGVLGTHFNVNGYVDEGDMRTTLLEGRVQVNGTVILKPGQQARVGKEVRVSDNVDVEQVMAWKNGLFSFDNADIQTVMRQVSRWYNVEVVYPAKIPKGSFSGEMGRDLRLSQVLKILEQMRVHFTIEDGKRIMILP